ncbi:ABC transporter permease [Mesorhizobium sp. Root552]|uniref:ABC transporter permease n=1 Tax=Mesorhizobium sp. Root552 TaxID=1736555 RepID=UPI0006F36A5D|nr:ABC transporter permease [Mesorhizobium sp. Root552]KQZ31650.1 ABC transporter permease [Mesorhizobium sp. Root552]
MILRVLVRRLISSIPVLLIVLIGLFVLLQFAPGDTVDALLAQLGGGGSEELAAELRRMYGLDVSSTARALNYLWNLVRFDLGYSAIYGKPVADVIFERVPLSLLMMGSALCFAFSIGGALGVLAARYVNRWPDTLVSTVGLIFYATPAFWFGLMGIVVFAVKLAWLPPGGIEQIGSGFTGIRRVLDIAWHLVLPVSSLALIFLATHLRIMRASMLEVMTLDFVRTARAKGVRESAVIYRHVLRNALLPMVTLLGLQAGTMLGGSVVIESVFSVPGLGRLAYESVVQRDLNTLLGVALISSILVIVINLCVDLLYAWLDPRIVAR